MTKKKWVIKLKSITAVDKNGYPLPYKSKMNTVFFSFDSFDKYIDERLRYVKKKYGEETTITKTTRIRTFRTRGK